MTQARSSLAYQADPPAEPARVSAELDAIDVRILMHVQHDASLSIAQLATRIGVAQAACRRRVQRLWDEGWIKRVVAIVDREKLGFEIKIFARVAMEKVADEERAAFFRAIDAIPEVVECYTVFGELDVMLAILAPDVRWYDGFVFRLFRLPGVKDVRSTIAVSECKGPTGIPLAVRQL